MSSKLQQKRRYDRNRSVMNELENKILTCFLSDRDKQLVEFKGLLSCIDKTRISFITNLIRLIWLTIKLSCQRFMKYYEVFSSTVAIEIHRGVNILDLTIKLRIV